MRADASNREAAKHQIPGPHNARGHLFDSRSLRNRKAFRRLPNRCSTIQGDLPR